MDVSIAYAVSVAERNPVHHEMVEAYYKTIASIFSISDRSVGPF